MGAWGTRLYDDDVAKDVKNEYIELLRLGKENEEATKQMIEKWDTEDIEEGPIFWFALANTQWEYGRLLEEVKKQALYYIKTGTDLERWKENIELYNKRKKVLEELEEKLNSPMPKPKRIVKIKPYICPWKIGDIYAYKIKNNEEYKGKYIVLIKIDEDSSIYDICPMIYTYNKLFDEIPTIEELRNVKYMPQFYKPTVYKGVYKNVLYKCLIWIVNSTKKYTDEYIYVGNMNDFPIPSNDITKKHKKHDPNDNYFLDISEFEEYIIGVYNKWKGIDYSN